MGLSTGATPYLAFVVVHQSVSTQKIARPAHTFPSSNDCNHKSEGGGARFAETPVKVYAGA